jgi:peptide/nickel transport system substrate-binding protein
VQAATGGDVHGDIASTILPPVVIGHAPFDLYPTPGGKGADTPEGLAAARNQLAQCGQPSGFTTNLAVQGDKPNRVAMAQAVQASLKRAGINVNIEQYPTSSYPATDPSFVHAHHLGLTIIAASPDWPTGYSMLYQMLHGGAIKPAGNFNISELDDPAINQAISSAISNSNADARAKAWGDIDKAAMQQAAVVPLLYSKYLLYRPDSATNVFVSPVFSQYDFLNVGTR